MKFDFLKEFFSVNREKKFHAFSSKTNIIFYFYMFVCVSVLQMQYTSIDNSQEAYSKLSIQQVTMR